MDRKQIIEELNKIASDSSFIYVLAGINRRDFCGTIEEMFNKDPKRQLNYNEFIFLFGLWIKNVNSVKIFSFYKNYEEVFNRVYELMEELHRTFFEQTEMKINAVGNIENKPKIINDLFENYMNDGDSFKETFFYGGVGAYDFQYVDLAKKKYKFDEEWIKHNKGFSLKDLESFFIHIKNLLTQKLNNSKRTTYFNRQEYCLSIFSLSRDQIIKNCETYVKILDCFSLTLGIDINQKFEDIGDFNVAYSKPILKLSDNSYAFLLPFVVAESIYESPYYWMIEDKTYKDVSLHNRGEMAENITYEMLSRVFKDGYLYKGVKIYKNKSILVTDIDLLAIEKDKAIVFQVKSKKLTNLSKKGSIESIKNDFSKAVEDAFVQGIESEKCILNSTEYNFIETHGKNINAKIDKINEVYIVCIVLDHYPAITHSTHMLLYGKYIQSTIAFSVLDLEVICKILNSPNKFFSYILARIESCKYYRADGELDLLGFYLINGLKLVEGVNYLFIDPKFGNIVDKKYYSSYAKSEIQKLNNEKIIKPNIKNRNDLCHCGSGKKFKKCHMNRDS